MLLSADDQLPYDRTALSKAFLTKGKTAPDLPAQQQGPIAGYNMASVERDLRSIPFSYSEHWNRKMRYVGHRDETNEVRFDGSPEAGPFIAYCYQDGQLAAALEVGRDQEMAELAGTRTSPPPR